MIGVSSAATIHATAKSAPELALFAAVIHRAVTDAQSGDSEALEWLGSEPMSGVASATTGRRRSHGHTSTANRRDEETMIDTHEQRPNTQRPDNVRRVIVKCERCGCAFALTIREYTSKTHDWRRLCPHCQDGGNG